MNKNFERKIGAAFVIGLLSTSAIAATASINQLPDKGHVTLAGVVDSVKNEREFTLSDNTGKIDIDITSNQSIVLEKGARVTVSGVVDKGLFGTDINADHVTVQKSLASAVGDAIEATTPISIDGAESSTIQALPDQGKVKISGTVTDVDDESKFTLRDQTGAIKVRMASEEKAVLTKGAEVTVIGTVDNGLLGKNINATKILVVASGK